MREILFRAKRNDYENREWVFGLVAQPHVSHKDGVASYYFTELKYGRATHRTVSGNTVGQYTGLTDKNGTMIFEGDIVKFGKYIYQITFECGSFALLDKQGLIIAKIGGINDHCYSLMNLHLECCWEENWAYDIEVIGNIHDNPELLKEGTPQ